MPRDSKDLSEGPLLKNIILYTIPIILTGILQLLFNAADLVVVGRFSGSDCVAAVGATGALINLLVNLFIGLSVGAGVTVAHGIGSGRSDDV
ncbi:MAG: MATE family efflux transporter, partial [Ruminococcus sp.]|nr:MATE family efflux transporter [Ruminococcus sp.]